MTQRTREMLDSLPLASSPQPAASRTAAWQQLAQRLAAIDDGSLVARRERELTAARQAIQQARDNTDFGQGIHVRVCRRMAPFFFDNARISNEQQLLAVVAREAHRLELVAQRAVAQERLELFTDLLRRVTLAAHGDAAMPAELPTLRHRLAQAIRQRDRATDMLQQLAAQQPPRAPKRFAWVTHSQHNRTPWLADLSPAQLDAARAAALERLPLAKKAADDLFRQQRSLAGHAERVRQAARHDGWFAGELRRAELLLDIATAETADAEFQQTQRQYEFQFVSAVRDLKQRSEPAASGDWKTPLVQLFRARANSTTAENLAQKTLVLDQWRLDGLEQLQQNGQATWKEEMAARVRRDETRQRIAAAKTERLIAKQLAKLLDEDAKRPPDDSVVIAH
jgi:hypothetical protein